MRHLISISLFLLVLSCSKDRATIQSPMNQTPNDSLIFEIYNADSMLQHNCCSPISNDSLIISAKPLIGDSDFIFYDTLQHYLILSASGKSNLASFVCNCTYGQVFVVTVNKSPIYNGQFRLGYSSASFHGPVIMDYWQYDATKDTLWIENGYPTSNAAPDVRYNPQIIKALVAMNKAK